MHDRSETYAAINKSIKSLNDPFTRLLEPSRYQALKRGNQGSVIGVGLEVGFGEGSDSQLVVRSLLRLNTCFLCNFHHVMNSGKGARTAPASATQRLLGPHSYTCSHLVHPTTCMLPRDLQMQLYMHEL